jgi:FTR1 family protein
MFESLVIVTREGVEAALVVAITLAYLERTGRTQYTPWVFGGVGVALVLSAIGAWWLPTVVADVEIVEGWAMLAGAVCVITLIVWLVRTGKRMKGEVETGIEHVQNKGSGMGWGLAVFVALMVVREGIETILFLTAISFNTQGLERLLGALLGLTLAVAFGVLFVRGTLRVDLGRFFRVTTVVLAVLAAQLLVGAYHEFAEVGWLPANRTSMAIVGPIVRYDSILFAVAVLLIMVLVGARSPAGKTIGPAANPAERRKVESGVRRERRHRQATLVAVVAVCAILLTGFVSQARVPARQAGVLLTIEDGMVRIPVLDVEDGRVHFFSTEVEGRGVRFFVVKRPQGDIVACFDACLICGDLGYYEEAGGVTCRNCTAPINPPTLTLGGGCNPIPLASERQGDALVIGEGSLAEGAAHFPPAS